MIAQLVPPDPLIIDDLLLGRVEAHVVGRAGGRVRDLRVEARGGEVVLGGRSRTYHAKQLAQEAALEITGGSMPLANEIEVV